MGRIVKHQSGVGKTDSVFDDPVAITVVDDESDPIEQRFAILGADAAGRILVVVYSWRADDIRLISTRRAEPGKERITIRLDCDILDYYRDPVERAGGGNYQTVINNVLRDYIEGKKSAPGLEDTLRRVIREELRTVS